MKTFSATDAAISGFAVVREYPKAVGVWSIVAAVASTVMSVLIVGLFGDQLQAFQDISQTQTPDPAATGAAFVGLAPMMLVSTVYNLVIYSVLLAAIYRTVLRPADDRRFFLRLGADELRQAGVSVLMWLLLAGLYVAVVVVIAGAAIVSPILAAMVALVVGPAALWAVVYFGVRLSLANVLTFAKGKVDIFGSMAVSKGRFWPMLGAYIVATVLAVIVYLLLFLIVTLVGGAISGFNLDTLGALMQSQTISMETLTSPAGLLRLVAGGPILILTSITLYAPSAYIFREVAGQPSSASEYFA